MLGEHDVVVVHGKTAAVRHIQNVSIAVLLNSKAGRVALSGKRRYVSDLKTPCKLCYSSGKGAFLLCGGAIATVKPRLNETKHVINFLGGSVGIHSRDIWQVVPVLGARRRQQRLLEGDDCLGPLRVVSEHNKSARLRDEEVCERIGGRVILRRCVQAVLRVFSLVSCD